MIAMQCKRPMLCLSCLQTCYKSKFITAELARLFSQSDDEEDFEGFSEEEEVEESERLTKPSKHKVVVDQRVSHFVNRNRLSSSITVCVCWSFLDC